MDNDSLQINIDKIINILGKKSTVVCKKFSIGKEEVIRAAVIYINALADKDFIDRDVLNPLMLYVNEKLNAYDGIGVYLSETYIPMSNTRVIKDVDKALEELKRGKTIVVMENTPEFIIIDTTGGEYRSVNEPVNEGIIRGAREGFVEKLETNISMLRRKIKDDNLVVEFLKVGRRSQTDVALVYLATVTDDKLVNKIRNKMSLVDIDSINASGELDQYIDKYRYNIFPQVYATERADKIVGNIMDGRVAVLVDGTPFAKTIPSFFTDFFQTTDDYFTRPILASFVRILRYMAAFIVVTLDPLFMTLIRSNNEFIPIKFIIPIAQARQGIALSVFVEIMLMEVIIEFLREGGLRLPSKIAQTLSVVGGIIIGDTAVKSRVVSSTTLFIVGITTICSFLISNYDMSFAVRFLKFPMLIMAYGLGIFGIAIGWYLIFVYLCSIEYFGVPYFLFTKSNMKDQFIRAPLWKMNERPDGLPIKQATRESDFREKVENGDDEQGQ